MPALKYRSDGWQKLVVVLNDLYYNKRYVRQSETMANSWKKLHHVGFELVTSSMVGQHSFDNNYATQLLTGNLNNCVYSYRSPNHLPQQILKIKLEVSCNKEIKR